MPLAKYIEHFQSMSRSEQISNIRAGTYSGEKGHLETLLKYTDDLSVVDEIRKKLGKPPIGITSVAVVEKGKTDTMSVLLTVATQINEKVERFQVVEKEATMIMLEVGLALAYVKENLPHGQLQKWMTANLTISHRHARRFSELAQVFIRANSLKPDEAFLLCDPANSKEALGDKLRQMAFDFLGDKTQAELFEQYKIKYQEKSEPKQLHLPKPKPLANGETQAHRDATELIYPLIARLNRWVVSDERVVQHLNLKELEVLRGDLIDAKRIVDGLIKAG
jgi:hypothetical protein